MCLPMNNMQQAKGSALAAGIFGKAMGNQDAARYVANYKQDFRTQHNGMSAAQMVGQRGQTA